MCFRKSYTDGQVPVTWNKQGQSAALECFSAEAQLRVSVSWGCEQTLRLNSQPTTAPVHRNHHPLTQILLGSLHEHSQPASRDVALLNGTHQLKTQEGERPLAHLQDKEPSQAAQLRTAEARAAGYLQPAQALRNTARAPHRYGVRGGTPGVTPLVCGHGWPRAGDTDTAAV